ncbi:hypothetical protein PN36_11460 [Candidatus Thiomargarita nelsonii]|uniref:Capsular polysaccharide phosphotransferase SacB n=1 Tax=Candidatus Thiomargarita nelsonii TaxID=1003181 RepID=A0A0A6P6K9_9GAMM|nr:hypothetical protein PN36_11460 [Candidatus Thiomargarita nelsonii]
MQNKPQVIEKSLLKSALKYRGSMSISEYQNYAAGILFLKKMNHAFESEREKLISEYLSQGISETKAKELAENENEYSKSFFLPKRARWASILNFQSQIGRQLNQATKSVEKMNPFLDGLLVGIDFSKLSDKKLKKLIEHISHCSPIAPLKKSLDYIDYYEKVKKSSANSVHKNGLISSVMSYVYQNRHSRILQFLIQNVKEYTYKNGIKPSTIFKLSLAQRNKPTYEKYEQILTQRRYQQQIQWQEIDVVYLWVDPNDLNWQTLKNNFTKDKIWPTDSVSTSRFADHDELRYSLRSLEQYAPWVRHIYIVTMLGQCPAWLKRSHPKITLVDHTEIIPPDYLPTFNSNTIQCHVHRIANLSDNFILMDDDVFFGNEVLFDDFIEAENGKMKVFLDDRIVFQGHTHPDDDTFKMMLKYTNERLDDKFGNTIRPNTNHYMKIFNKNVLEVAEKIFREEWRKIASHRFRLGTDISFPHIASYISLYLNQALVESNVDGIYVGYKDNIKYLERCLTQVKQRQPKFFCLNEESVDSNDNITRAVSNFLETYFPSKSSFEY